MLTCFGLRQITRNFTLSHKLFLIYVVDHSTE